MQEPNFERGIWAVVHTTGRKYIGGITGEGWPDDQDEHDGVFEVLRTRSFLEIVPALELHTALIPVMTPNGPGMQHVVQVLPIDGTEGPTRIYVVPDAIHLFKDMEDSDRKRHKDLVVQSMKQISAARAAARANIVLAKNLPGGNSRGAS